MHAQMKADKRPGRDRAPWHVRCLFSPPWWQQLFLAVLLLAVFFCTPARLVLRRMPGKIPSLEEALYCAVIDLPLISPWLSHHVNNTFCSR